MSRRTFTGLLILASVLASVLYLWQPWNPDEPSIKLGLDLSGGLRIELEADVPNPDPQDLATARNIIENRINEFGVSEPLIQTSGSDRIVVELPGLDANDLERALDLIGQQAVLEFRLVRTSAQSMPSELLTLADLEDVAFTGEIIRTASADFERVGTTALGPAVVFEIRAESARAFGDFTGGNVGRRMAIVLDGRIQTAPTLNSRISDSGQITGIPTLEEAADIALVLRSGSLPISLSTAATSAIGPTLGQDSINAGTRAALIGGGALIVFLLFFYGPLFGGVLSLGLGLIMLLVFGVLAGLGAALTLPGLAGLILTIGAGIDGNIISFERAREELRLGKGMRVAMRQGFQNSLSAIIDANVTSLLAAAALYQYTSGPVRGFAITLAIGLVASVFVNTVAVPWILDVLSLRIKRTYMRPGWFSDELRFIKYAPTVVAISALLVVGSVVVLSVKGLRLSTDFTGGNTVLLRVDNGTEVADLRSALDQPEFSYVQSGGATIVEVIDPATPGRLFSVRVGLTAEQEESEAFPRMLAEAVDGTVLSAEFVGPSVGADLRRGAVLAVLVSLGLILIYISWRFWPNWVVAFGVVLATAHDTILTLGFLDLWGAEFSIPVLAALLFVVGYSLNDSIVIADRFRENRGKVRDRDYAGQLDMSISQTLSRTIVTSGSTLIVVVALLLFGGPVLRDMSIALVFGVVVGSFSSLFVLPLIVTWLHRFERQGRRRGRNRAVTA